MVEARGVEEETPLGAEWEVVWKKLWETKERKTSFHGASANDGEAVETHSFQMLSNNPDKFDWQAKETRTWWTRGYRPVHPFWLIPRTK